MDTPVTSPEGSDKGGKLPRQLQLSPASARHFHVVSYWNISAERKTTCWPQSFTKSP